MSLSICQAGLGWRQHTQLSICRLGWPSLSIWDKHIRLGLPGANAYRRQLSVIRYRVGPFALWGCAGRGLQCSCRRPIHAFSGRQATVPDTGTAAWPLEAVPATCIARAASDSTAALSVRIVRGRCRCNLRALTRQAGCRHRGRCKQPLRTCWWRGQAAAAGTGVACCRVLHAAQHRRATSSSRRPC